MRRHVGEKLRLRDSFPFVEALSKLPVKQCKVDIGKLAVNYWRNHGDTSQVESYMAAGVAQAINHTDDVEAKDVVLYGFGRIGRLLARLLIERTGRSNKLRLRAIVLRGGRPGDLKNALVC